MPLSVRNLSFTSLNTSSISVSWKPPIEGMYQSFKIYTESIVVVVGNKTTSVHLTDLTSGSLYNISMEAVAYNLSSENMTLTDASTCEWDF